MSQSCSKTNFVPVGSTSSMISGVVSPLVGLIAQVKSRYLFPLAYAAVCTDPVYANIYSIEADGTLASTPLATQTLDSTATYKFDAAFLGISLSNNVQYLVEITGCTNSTVFLSRPITEIDENQDIDNVTTLVSLTTIAVPTKKINETTRNEIKQLISDLNGANASSVNTVYQNVIADITLEQKFLNTFISNPSDLINTVPNVLAESIGTIYNEKVAVQLSANAVHWKIGYTIVYKWVLDGVEKATGNQWSFYPEANDQGTHTINLYIGKSAGDLDLDGDLDIDTSVPYLVKTYLIDVLDTSPAIAPSLSIASSNVSSRNITLAMNTGLALLNCDSFTNLALTENSVTAPVNPAAYTITCDDAVSQAISYNLVSPGDGTKTLRLWARDAAGTISGVPNSLDIELDSTFPIASLSDIVVPIRGSQTLSVALSASDNAALATLSLYYAQDGTTFSLLTNALTATSSSYNWSVPSHNTTSAKLKLVATDTIGNVTTIITAAFTIDSTAPAAPAVTLASANPTNNTSITLTVSSCTDRSFVIVNESTSPSLLVAGWVACSTMAAAIAYTLSGSTEGPRSVNVWARDAVGNISSSSYLSLVLDQIAPGVPAILFSSNSTLSEQKTTSSTTLTVSSCTDRAKILIGTSSTQPSVGDTGWQNCSTSPAAITYALSTVVENSYSLYAWAKDTAGNISATSTALTFIYDATAPVVTSFQLASGASYVASPTVTISITASDALTGILQMRLSETMAYANDNWVSYASSGQNFNLSQTNGDKTVYLWLKDASGNISSSPTAYNIGLDYGNPPTITITSPVVGSTYVAGNTVPIAWSCSTTSPSGLAAAPIAKIEYTADDGVSFVNPSIAVNLTNNVSASEGSYDWTLPAGVTIFRLLVSCKSAAGVVSSAYSPVLNSSGWSIFMGDPSNGVQNVNALVTNAGWTGSTSWVTSDANNNIYYTKPGALMKINASTGLVTTFMGDVNVGGCGTGSVPTGRYLSGAKILGMDANHENLLVLSNNCQRIYSVNVKTSVSTEWAVLPASVNFSYLTRLKILVYQASNRIYKLDLSSAGNASQLIYGDGTFTTVTGRYVVNTVVTGLQLARIGANPSQGEGFFVTSDDASKIWLGHNGNNNAYVLEENAEGAYFISIADFGSNPTNTQNCVRSNSDAYVYCSSRDISPGGRVITRFDLASGTFPVSWTMPYDNNDNTGSLHLGVGVDRLVATYSLNGIFTIIPSLAGSWSSTKVAGQYLAKMGNGTTPEDVGFDAPIDIKYSAIAQKLWVRNMSGHLRQVDFSTSPLATTTIFQSAILAYGSDILSFVPNLAGDKFLMEYSCARRGIRPLSLASGVLSTTTNFLTGPCDQTTGNAYPPTTGASAGNVGTSTIFRNHTGFQNGVYHTNGNAYFASLNGTSDVFVFKSDGSTLTRIAGKAGVGGYVALDDGTSALGASLTRVDQLQEIASGTYAQDLLIWDSNRLRRISIGTEPADPKIYDVVSFSIAGAGYTIGASFIDAYYDQSSEQAGVLGTGKMYYVDGSNFVHKFVPAADLMSATDTKFTFTGTTFSGRVRITLTPAGLLVLQPNKARILRVEP